MDNTTFCSPNDIPNYLDSPEFHKTFLHIFGFLAIPFHIFGAYCIIFETPKEMKSVKWSLLNFQIAGCLCDMALSFLGTIYILVPLMASSPLGILKDFGLGMAEISYVIQVIIAMQAVAVLVLLENRFNILSGEITWWQYVRYPFLGFNYLTACTFFLPIYLKMPPGLNNKKDLILQALPCLSNEAKSLPLYLVVEDKWQFVTYTWSESSLLFIEIVILFFLVIRSLRKLGRTLSQKTIEMRKRLMRALFLQIAIPFFIVFVPLSYYAHTPVYYAWANNIAYIIIACHGLLSTIVMLVVQKPYRDFVLGAIRWRSSNVSESSPTSMNNAQSFRMT